MAQTAMEMDTTYSLCSIVLVLLQCLVQCKSRKSPSITLGFGNCIHCNHHPFSSTSNMKCL